MFLDKLKDILLPMGMYIDMRTISNGLEYFFEFPAPWTGLNFFFLRYNEPEGYCEFYPQYKNVNLYKYRFTDEKIESILEEIKKDAITFKEGYEKRYKRYKKSLVEQMKMDINEDFV
jgi:hypothetical protein